MPCSADVLKVCTSGDPRAGRPGALDPRYAVVESVLQGAAFTQMHEAKLVVALVIDVERGVRLATSCKAEG